MNIVIKNGSAGRIDLRHPLAMSEVTQIIYRGGGLNKLKNCSLCEDGLWC